MDNKKKFHISNNPKVLLDSLKMMCDGMYPIHNLIGGGVLVVRVFENELDKIIEMGDYGRLHYWMRTAELAKIVQFSRGYHFNDVKELELEYPEYLTRKEGITPYYMIKIKLKR